MDKLNYFINKNLEKDINEIEKEIYFFGDENLSNAINEEISHFLNYSQVDLQKKFPFYYELEKLKEYEKDKKEFLNFKEVFNFLRKLSRENSNPFNDEWWLNEIKNYKNLKYKEKNAFKELIFNECKKNLDILIENWKIKEIERIRKEFLEKFKDRIQKIKKLYEIISNLDLGTGFLWDLCKRDITNTDISILLEWIEILKNNKEIIELSNLLGKIRVYKKNLNQEKILKTINKDIKIPIINSKEEITGIKIGKSIENLLSNELLLLNDSELEILFDLKFIEEKLMLFDFQSFENTIEKEKVEETKNVEQEEKGPIILCIDTSGSMSGAPETIAKAISFCILAKAVSEKRNCLLINFSTEIEVIELNSLSSFSKILSFLRKSFHGGTDIYSAIDYSIKKIKEENFKKSDILIVSDFIIDNIGSTLEEEMKKIKLLENKFYSLSIGNLFLPNSIDSIFSKQWVYNPNTSSINLLNKITEFDK